MENLHFKMITFDVGQGVNINISTFLSLIKILQPIIYWALTLQKIKKYIKSTTFKLSNSERTDVFVGIDN